MESDLDKFLLVHKYAVHAANYDLEMEDELEEILTELWKLDGSAAREAREAMLEGNAEKPLAFFAARADADNAPASYHRYCAILAFCVHRPDALPFLKKARKAEPHDIMLHYFYAMLLINQGQDDAMEVLEQFVAKNSSKHFKTRRARAFDYLAGYYWEQGRFEAAIEAMWESLYINNKLDRRPELTENCERLGKSYFKLGKMKAAEELYDTALIISQDRDDFEKTAQLRLALAKVYLADDRTDKAIDTYRAILSSADHLATYTMLTLLHELASTYHEVKDYDSEIEILTQSLALNTELEDDDSIIIILNRLAEAHAKKGDLDRAKDLKDRSRRLAKNVVSPWGRC